MIERFPDGTPIDRWFYERETPAAQALGKRYCVTDFGVADDGCVHTAALQRLIDEIAASGGGVLTVPAGVYRTGALFFRPGVHLRVEAGGTLLGSDDIADYPVVDTRIEGESCRYFAALINADRCDGFTMLGPGAIDGNGMRAWRAFWLRRSWNPKCTNKDEQRPRLVYISNSENVTVDGLTLRNSPFWTNHLYRCRHTRFMHCRVTSPTQEMRAPSTDALDLDVCSDVLVWDCHMSVDDDAVVIKGGKGPWADQQPENGGSERVLVEDCVFDHSSSCLTVGSEAIYCRNVLLRRARCAGVHNVLRLKLRPDTPQHYQYVAVEDVSGTADIFFRMDTWMQFFDLKGRQGLPPTAVDHVVMRRCRVDCDTRYEVSEPLEDCDISEIVFEEISGAAKREGSTRWLKEGKA